MLPSAWRIATTTTTTTAYNIHNKDDDAADTTSIASTTCLLYFAESTIPNAGLGIFAGKAFDIGDDVGNGDVAIPVVELSLHNEEPYFDPTSNYVWEGPSMGMGNDVTSDEIHAYWPGINCAVNCYAALINLEPSSPIYDEAGVHRLKHPGAGAFSPYHLGITQASRNIPAGGELFKDYGDAW
jgi:hypothetical protein